MIIWGSRGVTSSVAKGQFHCPSCNDDRPFDHKKARRFFTLYFIPLIPLESLGEYVECQACKGTYKPEVLQYDPRKQQEAFRNAFHHALRRTAVTMMLRDGPATAEETAVVTALLSESLRRPLSAADVSIEIDKATTDPRPLPAHLAEIAGELNSAGKEMLVRVAVRVAVADGPLQAAERALLQEVGVALQISSAHLNGIVAEVAGQA
jgi:uncharacterized tellurite resistance protein B-like protein